MNNQPQQSNSLDPQVASIVKALAYTENGGAPDVSNPSSGKTGEEKSIFQFEPGTWKAYSKQVSGNSNLPLTPENESLVAYTKVGNWLKQGYTVPQIASMWNAGPGEPDAYNGKFSDGTSSQGVNKKYGVNYDVPGYAEKVENYVKEFSKQSPQQSNNNPVSSSISMNSNNAKQVPKKKNTPKSQGQMLGLATAQNPSLLQGSAMLGQSS